jgi:hypothetical protein
MLLLGEVVGSYSRSMLGEVMGSYSRSMLGEVMGPTFVLYCC